jgi:hypothetical protein
MANPEIDALFGRSPSSLKVDGLDVSDDELYEALMSERLGSSYGTTVDDYESTAEALGYNPNPSEAVDSVTKAIRERNKVKELARQQFDSTSNEILRDGLVNKTKDIPVLGTATKIWADLHRLADIATASVSDLALRGISGTLEQVAASGTIGTGAPGIIRQPGEPTAAEGAAELVAPLKEIREGIKEEFTDPDLAATILGQTVQIASQIGAGAGIMAINPTSAIAMFEGIAFNEAVEAYDTYAKNPNPEDRLKFGITVALPTAALDTIGAERMLGKVLSGKLSLRKQIYARLAASMPAEGGTEVVQSEILNFMLNTKLGAELERDKEDRIAEFLIGMAGAGVVGGAIAVPALRNAKIAEALDNENFSAESVKAMQNTVTEEEFIDGTQDDAAQEALMRAMYNGDPGARQAYLQMVEQQNAKAEVKVAEDTVQISKEGIIELRQARKDFIQPDLPSSEKVAYSTVFEKAQKQNKKEEDRIILADVSKSRRAMTIEEHAAVSLKATELMNKHDKLVRESAELIQNGETEKGLVVSQKADAVSEELDFVERIADEARSEAGRVLGIGRARINREDLSLGFLIRKATTLKGEKLTGRETRDIERLVKKLEAKNKELEDLKNKLAESSGQSVFELMSGKGIGKRDRKKLVKLAGETSLAKRRARERVYKFKEKTLWDKAISLATAPRALIASLDLSATLRQGGMLLPGHPVVAAEALQKSLKAFASEAKAEEVDLYLKARPSWDISKRAGLHHSSLSNMDLNAREQQFQSAAADVIPWVKASNRQMATQLNFIRANVFDIAYNDLKQRGLSEKEMMPILEKYAKFVNAATGRGSLFGFEKSAKGLAAVFFAPRYAISRFEAPVRAAMMMNTPLAGSVAKDVGSFVGVILSTLALASWAGAEVEWDSESSDFLKIKIGDTRLDISGGFQQALRLVINSGRAGLGQTGFVEKFDRDMRNDLANFFMYKSSPAVTMGMELMTGEDVVGNEINFLTSDPEELTSNFFLKNTVPLFIQDAWEATVSGDAETLGLSVPLTALGIGVQTYD